MEVDLEEKKAASNSGGIGGWRSILERKRDEWKTVPLNLAVIGYTDVGKSSFINAIRGLIADDQGAAPVGVKETTVDSRSYPHPNNPLLKFWDLPGFGTDRFPRQTYLTDIDVDRYDFFLLITATRFTENDTWLGNELRKRNKKYFFIRTGIGVDISNDKKAHPRTHNEEAVVRKIRESTEKHLRETGCEYAPVFLIDSYKPMKFDFDQLLYRMIQEFPNLKKHALTLSFQATYREMIRLKVAELRTRMWIAATLAGAVGAIPVPAVSASFDIVVVTFEVRFYFTQLGLDETSLKRYSKFTSIDHQQLQDTVHKCLGFNVAGVETIRELLKTAGPLMSCAAASEVVKFFPVVGSLIAAPLSFGGTQYTLKRVLGKMESAALEVIQVAEISAADADDD